MFQKGGLCKYNHREKIWESQANTGGLSERYSSLEAKALNLLELTSSNGSTNSYNETAKIWGFKDNNNCTNNKCTINEITNEIAKRSNLNSIYKYNVNLAIGYLVKARESREEYPVESEDIGHKHYREAINRLINTLSESQRTKSFTGNSTHPNINIIHGRLKPIISKTISKYKSDTSRRRKAKGKSRTSKAKGKSRTSKVKGKSRTSKAKGKSRTSKAKGKSRTSKAKGKK